MPPALVSPTSIIQLILAIWLLSRQEMHREGFAWRCVASITTILGFCIVANMAVAQGSPLLIRSLFISGTVCAYTLLIIMCTFGLRLCYDISLWSALFCCSAAYIMQNLAAGLEELVMLVVPPSMPDLGILFTAGSSAFVYALCYLLFVRRIERQSLGEIDDRRMLFAVVVVVLVNVAFDMGIKLLPYLGVPVSLTMLFRLVQIAVGVFTLFAEYSMLFEKKLQAQAEVSARLMAERERQYELSRETIDAINLKCHDLRHQIRSLRSGAAQVTEEALASLEHDVDIYDARIATGNDALDTILTEKSLACSQEGIELSCIADGQALGFMEPPEIYALFGNALDNAIEAVRQVDAAMPRRIAISVRKRGILVIVHIENPYAGERSFADGLPQTTKEDALGHADAANHGFGTRSMRATVERYGGTLTYVARDGIFSVNMLLPAQEL